MNRDIHIGHLLEMDKDGIGYCSLLALSKHHEKEKIMENISKNIKEYKITFLEAS